MKIRKFLIAVFSMIAIIAVILIGINVFVVLVGGHYLVDENDISDTTADCILVLGAGVNPDGTPSKILQDRLDKAIDLYWDGAADKLLLSGDNGTVEYNEVKAMKNYVVNAGVPASDVFLDHAGFSTYESMYRAKKIFGVKSAIVVTQQYHEYRALYIGHRLGMDVRGIAAENKHYSGQATREVREFLAREKDFVSCITWPKPTYLGNKIDLSGDGEVSW